MKTLRTKHWHVGAAFLLSLAGACGNSAATPSASAREEREPRSVRLLPVQTRELARTLAVTGTLAADEQVQVSTQVVGRLERLAVDLGSSVRQGDVIAQIETRDYALRVEQAASLLAQARARLGLDPQGTDETVDVEQTNLVLEAQATLQEATSNLERSRTLVEQRLIARAEFDAANATYVRSQTALANAREEIRNRIALLRQRHSELELARKQLSDTTIRSPLTGIVQARRANSGEYLPVGTPVADIVRVNPLRLRAEVPEREAANVHVGQVVRFVIDGQVGTFEGQVARLSPSLATQSRTLVVEASIPNPGNLRPGSFARAEVVLDGAVPVAGVPPETIVNFAGIEKVLTVDAGKIAEKRITTGRHTPDFVEVLAGVTANDEVVAQPGNLQQGEAVRVVEARDSARAQTPEH